MNVEKIKERARRYSRTNAANYLDTQLLEDINIVYHDINLQILKAQGYKNLGQDYKTYDLVDMSALTEGSIGYRGEFPFPADAIRIERIELDYGNGYVEVKLIRLSDLEGSAFDEESYDYSKNAPVAFILRDSIHIRPLHLTTTVVDGLKLVVAEQVTPLVNDTDEPNFDDSLHDLIPLKTAQNLSLIYPEKANSRIDQKVADMEADLYDVYERQVPLYQTMKPKKQTYITNRRNN